MSCEWSWGTCQVSVRQKKSSLWSVMESWMSCPLPVSERMFNSAKLSGEWLEVVMEGSARGRWTRALRLAVRGVVWEGCRGRGRELDQIDLIVEGLLWCELWRGGS